MKILKKVVVHTKKYNIRRIYLFNIPLFQYIKIRRNRKKYKFYSLIKRNMPSENQRIFYLKVHRVHKLSIDCIKQWVNIVTALNGFIYFVCDNPKMESDIFNCIQFSKKNFDFIKSDRKTLKNEIEQILNKVERAPMWKRIAYSMLTPFLHAQKNNYKISYNIDADDILICDDPNIIAEAIKKAETYAINNNLDLFNLDMVYSKSFGVHWSFGVVMCLNPKKCIDIVKKNVNWRINQELIDKYNICWINKFNFNVDWLFTYLRDTNQLNMKTFYIENGLVIHMPDLMLEHGWAFVLQWKNNHIQFPLLTNTYNKKIWDIMPIPEKCVKIDVGVEENDYKNFLKNFYDYGVGFELDMLNYAKERNLISDDLFRHYASTKEFVEEVNFRETIVKKSKVRSK